MLLNGIASTPSSSSSSSPSTFLDLFVSLGEESSIKDIIWSGDIVHA